MTRKPSYEQLEQRIQALQQSHALLREREQRFLRLIEQSPDLVFRLNLLDGRYEYVSCAAETVFGCSPEQWFANAQIIIDSLHPEDVSRYRKNWHHLLKGPEPQTWEYRIIDKTGQQRWLSQRNVVVRDGTGRPTAVEGVISDISERKNVETALRESKDRLSFVLEGSQLGFWDWNIETGQVYRNERWAEMLGYTLEEIQFTVSQWTDLHHPDDRDAAWQSINDHLQGKTAEHKIEYRMRAKDGTYRWILDQAKIVRRDIHGNPLRMSGTHTDITERKQMEESLRLSERKLRMVIEATPFPVAVADKNGDKIMYWSRSALNLFGHIADSLTDWHQIAYPDPVERNHALQRWKPAVDNAKNTDKPTNTGEYQIHCADGSIRLCEIFATYVSENLIITFNDISERKRTEEELRKRESQLQRIFEIIPIGLWFADRQGTLQRGNPAGIRIWGGEPKATVPEYGIFKAWRLPSKEEVKAEDWALLKTIRDGVTITDELLEIEAFDGKRKIILNYTAPVLDGQGVIDGAIVVNLDITELKTLEDQLNQSHKLESIGRLAGGVAHDFNNMLSVILGHAEMALARTDGNQPVYEDLEEIRKAAARSAGLTRQLLAFARKQTIVPKALNLNDQIGNSLKMLQRLIGEDIVLNWRPGEALWQVHMDPTQIDQILANLCVNGRDAIAGVGTIDINTCNVDLDDNISAIHRGAVPGAYVLLSVSDTGSGMSKETLDHLYEPFFTTKPMSKGTGLGLAMVYGIVRQNGGFIDAKSTTGRGTMFRIYLPRHSAPAQAEQADEPFQSPPGGNATILVVEDEPAILRMTTIMLKHFGYRVLAAASPAEAIKIAESWSAELHLLLTDVVMPEMNGRDLAGILTTTHPRMKQLFMSGYTADVIAQNDLSNEGLNYLQKPFSQTELANKVKQVLGSRMLPDSCTGQVDSVN